MGNIKSALFPKLRKELEIIYRIIIFACIEKTWGIGIWGPTIRSSCSNAQQFRPDSRSEPFAFLVRLRNDNFPLYYELPL